MDYLSLSGLRLDGRRANELRHLQSNLGFFQQVHGSAYVEMGQTKVLAVVHGPHAVHKGNDQAAVSCTFVQAAFASMDRKWKHSKDRQEIEWAGILTQALETLILRHLYPRTGIEVYVEVVQNDGGALATSLNTAMLALVNAGIAVRDLMVACSAGILEGQTIWDLNEKEENGNVPQLTVAMLPKYDKLCLIQLECKVTVNDFETLLEHAKGGCSAIAQQLRTVVEEHTWQLITRRDVADLN